MPGNELGERIHNFFGQESISQEQHQSQVVDGSWSSFSNGLVGNQRQRDPSLIANLKSYSAQQSGDPEREQSSASQHGLNFTQQPISSEYSRSLLQEYQQPANGYMHGNLVLQASQASPNEAIFLGMDGKSGRDKSSAGGLTPDLHKSPMRFDMGESPVNYDFFGGQQQLNSQHPGMLQPFPRQQMTFNDMQLLKQQVMVRQVHEYQKQHQEARQFNSLNSNAVNGSHSSDNQSHPLINGIPLQDTSSNCWQPDLVTGNTNWMYRSISPVFQGSSSGLMIPPVHGQANLLAQQFEPSLYGMTIDGANAPRNSVSSVQMDSLATQHGSANRSSSLTNQTTSFLNQGDVHDNHMLPTSTYLEKLSFSNTSVPGSNNRPNFESFQQDDSHQRNISVQENFGQMEHSRLSEKSYMKMPENIIAMQKSTTLDPTEEKILFGSDGNLWDAFGNSTDMSFTGNLMSNSSDLYDACPSLQSGSWSALMQSAVAETSSDDASVHKWGSKHQSLWANNNTALHANSIIDNRAQDLGVKASRSGVDGQNNSCSIRKNEGIEDRLGIWKAASNPNLAALKEQKNQFTQSLQMRNSSYGEGNDSSAPKDVQGNIQHHLDNNSVEKDNPQLKSRDGRQILESYASKNAGSNEMVNACDLSMLPGGKETQSGHVGNRPSISRKFQYHSMGNIDVTDEPGREKVSHFGQSKSLSQPALTTRIDERRVSQNDLNCTFEAFRGMGSENSPTTSASPNRSVGTCNQVKNASSRLELLNKSQEHCLEKNVSRIPEATPSAEYNGQFQHSHLSASQGFSLQLAPPSQLAPSPDNVKFSQNSLQQLNLLYTAPEKGGTGQSRFAPWPSNQSFPQQFTYQGPFSGIPGESNVTSGFSYSRGFHQNQLMPVDTRQSSANYAVNSSSELSTPQVKEKDECSDIDQRGHSAQTPSLLNPTTYNNTGNSAEGFPILSASQHPVESSSSQRSCSSGMMSDSQAGISAQQHRFWNQQFKPPGNNIEGSFERQETTNQTSSQNKGAASLSGREMVNMHELQSKDMGAKQTSDVATTFSKTVQSNLQNFGHTLPSNNIPKDNVRHDEHMAVKRFEDSAFDPQKAAQQSPSRSDGLIRDGLNHMESSKHVMNFGQTVPHNLSNKNHAPSRGPDHQQISPQMAPSWYSQYGNFKNGLVQSVNDTGRFTPLKIGEESSNGGSSVDGSHSVQSSKKLQTVEPNYTIYMHQMPGSAPAAETLSSESLPHVDTAKLLKVDIPKKRKTTTPKLLSWNKEVTQGPHRLETLGEAEDDWARATNRFAEKVEFENFLDDDPRIRSKRRLIYTTQIMQQLFRAPPAKVISLVASSNYEFVAYTVTRAALGIACSSTCTDMSERFLRPNNSNPLSERTKTEKISDQYICKAAEDFITRTWKLETDFAGLENGPTISDLRVEVQDLEKFAVINRFARFHPSSSSMDRTASSLRSNPQRYVTVAPMPRNIPDRVQCLSL